MIHLIYSIFGFLICIAVLVAFHEFGHFYTAKRCGVKVLKFAIGFGKPLFVRQVGETEYSLRAIPLGGFVQMLGQGEKVENPDEQKRAFDYQPLYKRALIVAAGPIFNFILAIALFFIVYALLGSKVLPSTINYVATDSWAQKQGIIAGDQLIEVNGSENNYWNAQILSMTDTALNNGVLELTVKKTDGRIVNHDLDFAVNPWSLDSQADILADVIGIFPYELPPAILGAFAADGVLEGSQLLPNDKILKINGAIVNHWGDLVRTVQTLPGQNAVFEVQRDGDVFTSELMVGQREMPDGGVVGYLGVSAAPFDFNVDTLDHRYSPLAAINKAFKSTYEYILISFKSIWKMLKLEVSVKNISGPLTIADFAGKTAQSGLDSYVRFMAIISIALGVMNLLPIPFLDGGHLLLYGAEAIKGKPLSDLAYGIFQRMGLIILGALMFLAFYNDIFRLIG